MPVLLEKNTTREGTQVVSDSCHMSGQGTRACGTPVVRKTPSPRPQSRMGEGENMERRLLQVTSDTPEAARAINLWKKNKYYSQVRPIGKIPSK